MLSVALLAGCNRERSTPAFVVQPARPPDPTAGAAPLFTIDLQSPRLPLAALASYKVTVDDPVYKQTKHYQGVRLNEVVDTLAPAASRIPETAHLVMVCLDGYRAALPLSLARQGGILANRDIDAKEAWEALPAGTAVKTPAPYYLVWEPSAAAGAAKLPWPYGVVGIEVWSADPADRARPVRTDGAVGRGYEVFRQKCISCHRINGAGGTLGAELNTPVNVTEYWNRIALKQFILDPTAIRADSKMPRLSSLTSDEVESVLSYLDSMKYQKLALKSRVDVR